MTIKLRFIDEGNIFALGIKWWTWSDLSHVEFIFPDGYLGARPIWGVKVRRFNYCQPIAEYFATVNCSDLVSKKVESFLMAQLRKPYDYLGILGFVVKHDFHSKKSWFCSELVAAAFEVADYPLLDLTQLDRVSPRDIALSPFVHMDTPYS